MGFSDKGTSGAVAGLPTEPLGRPQASRIAGDLRSAVSTGSETRAERGFDGVGDPRRAMRGRRPAPSDADAYFRSTVTFSILPVNANGTLYSWLTGVPVLRPIKRP